MSVMRTDSAFARQRFRTGLADARGTPGDDGDLTRDLSHEAFLDAKNVTVAFPSALPAAPPSDGEAGRGKPRTWC